MTNWHNMFQDELDGFEPEDCEVVSYSSRVCQIGVKSCVVDHGIPFTSKSVHRRMAIQCGDDCECSQKAIKR